MNPWIGLLVIICFFILGFLSGVIAWYERNKLKNVGTLMIIETEEGPQLFVELNQEIHKFKDEKRVSVDISHK